MLPVGLIGGGLAVAGVVVILDRRRRAQQRHRGTGRRVVMPPDELAHGERALREGADVDGARLLDLAVRAAAAGMGATGLPPLRWVEVTADDVELVLEEPSLAPTGFEAVADRWVTDASVDGLASLAEHAAMPAPTLIPVGTTSEDAELLVELEASTVVTVVGPPDQTLDIIRAVAVAVATGPWSEQSQVQLVAMDGELVELPWVRTVPRLADALAAAEAHLDRATFELWSQRAPSVAQARAAGVSAEAWEPLVVVSAAPPADIGEIQRLAALARRPHAAVAVVIPAPDRRPIGRAFTVGEDGWLRIDGVDPDVWPHRLSDEDAGRVAALLDLAAQRGDVAPGTQDIELEVRRPPSEPPAAPYGEASPHPEPPAELPGEASPQAEDEAAPGVAVGPTPGPGAAPVRRLDALLDEVEVLVRVLGEVEAVRRAKPGPRGLSEQLVPTRQKGLEAISYLALRQSAVDREDLEIVLFPDGANAVKTVYNTVSAARTMLGDELFPPSEGGRYELSEQVVTDYGVFCDLVAQAEEAADDAVAAELLADGLGLVRGEPFTGVGRSYAWVGPHRGMIVAQVIDAAEALAEHQLSRGDWRAAEWAARQGLRAFPSDERMYRLLMRAARASGNMPGVQRVFRELCDVIADPDSGVEPEDTLHPETVALMEQLTGVLPDGGQLGA